MTLGFEYRIFSPVVFWLWLPGMGCLLLHSPLTKRFRYFNVWYWDPHSVLKYISSFFFRGDHLINGHLYFAPLFICPLFSSWPLFNYLSSFFSWGVMAKTVGKIKLWRRDITESRIARALENIFIWAQPLVFTEDLFLLGLWPGLFDRGSILRGKETSLILGDFSLD